MPLKPFIILASCIVFVISAGAYAVSSLLPDDEPEKQAAPVPEAVLPSPSVASTTFLGSPNKETDALPDGYVGHSLVKNEFGIHYEVYFRYQGNFHYVSDFDYSVSGRRFSIFISPSEIFEIIVPKEVVSIR